MAEKYSAFPYSLEAEQSILGCLLVDQEIQLETLALLQEEDFYIESHKLIVRAMKDIVRLIGEGRIDPAPMVTHIGGMDAVIDTTKNLPTIPGGKKLIYTHIQLPLTALAEFEEKGKTDARFAALDAMVKEANGLWCAEAEAYLLANF